LVSSPTTGGAVTVRIPVGSSNSPNSVASGGVAFQPLSGGTTTVSVTIPGYITTTYATREVVVSTSGITMYTATVGAGLQVNTNAILEGSDHGGVDVVITSTNPSVLLVSPNSATPGTASITVPVANGGTSAAYYVQGFEGATGTVTVTATATGLFDGTTTTDVVQPALQLVGLYASPTTTAADDPFEIRVGIPNATQTAMQSNQWVRAGAPSSITATVVSSDAAVGQLVTTTLSGATVTVNIVSGQYRSPYSVATGGVAFDPLTAGPTTVSATITGFVTLPLNYGSIAITVTTP
jgi:hypothetical protein